MVLEKKHSDNNKLDIYLFVVTAYGGFNLRDKVLSQ